MSSNKNLVNYVSELDRFLKSYDEQHPKMSLSQLQEIAKSKRIYHLRDDATTTEPSVTLWKEF